MHFRKTESWGTMYVSAYTDILNLINIQNKYNSVTYMSQQALKNLRQCSKSWSYRYNQCVSLFDEMVTVLEYKQGDADLNHKDCLSAVCQFKANPKSTVFTIGQTARSDEARQVSQSRKFHSTGATTKKVLQSMSIHQISLTGGTQSKVSPLKCCEWECRGGGHVPSSNLIASSVRL